MRPLRNSLFQVSKFIHLRGRMTEGKTDLYASSPPQMPSVARTAWAEVSSQKLLLAPAGTRGLPLACAPSARHCIRGVADWEQLPAPGRSREPGYPAVAQHLPPPRPSAGPHAASLGTAPAPQGGSSRSILGDSVLCFLALSYFSFLR